MYTLDDAKRECREMEKEGYGFGAIRVFLNDLARSGDITWKDVTQIQSELYDEGMDCSISTF